MLTPGPALSCVAGNGEVRSTGESPGPPRTAGAAQAAPAAGVVNGPEDEPLCWDRVSWLSAEENVRRLRQRIFTASQAGDLKRVRNLQKLMLRSRSNTLFSLVISVGTASPASRRGAVL